MQKSQTKRDGLPFVRSGIFRYWTVKNDVFRCSRYVALPAIIPYGRGESERFIHGGDGDVGYSVSKIVERGKSGIWTYTKYADGTAECYGTAKHSLTQKGTFWLPEISLPFTLVKPANSYDDFTVIVSGGSYFAPMLYPFYPTDKSSISTVGCAVTDVRETGDITVGYFVRGRWK